MKEAFAMRRACSDHEPAECRDRDSETVLGTSKRLDHTRSSGFAKVTL
ncbi:MAG: hypothetical protein ACSHYA_19095 [Opitutaceae bacterium]